MKLNDDHFYHGAALTQIAEHPRFTAINAFENSQGISRSSFLINHDVGIYLKYATKPNAPYGEYLFNFSRLHLRELKTIEERSKRVYLVLICVEDRQICCIPKDVLMDIILHRKRLKPGNEESYNILVTCPKGKKLRAYINAPHKKKVLVGKHLFSRNSFPSILFGNP